MRLNNTKPCNEIIRIIKKPITLSYNQEKEIIVQDFFSKQQLWDLFLFEFKLIVEKKFILNPQNINNIKTLFYYFLGDDAFLTCENVKSNLSKPSFEKGLMIVGGFGIGKTVYFKVFEKIFKKHPKLRFKGFGAKELVNQYEACQKPFDKSYMLKHVIRPRLFIDDINSEREASNFGKCEVVEEILFMQNEKKHKTFVTCNYTTPNHDIEQTLLDMAERYGGRLHDRFFKMFNIIEFPGKSMRR